jgi:hypothetical protein
MQAIAVVVGRAVGGAELFFPKIGELVGRRHLPLIILSIDTNCELQVVATTKTMKFLFLLLILLASIALHAVAALPDDEIMQLTTDEQDGHPCYENEDNPKYNTVAVLVKAEMEVRYNKECGRRLESTKNLRGRGRNLLSMGGAICRASRFACAFYNRRRKLATDDEPSDDEYSDDVVSMTMPLEEFLGSYQVHNGNLHVCVEDLTATFEYRC